MRSESPPAAVTLVEKREHEQAAAVLGRAFHNDPQWMALMPGPEDRRWRLPTMFTGTVKMTTAAGGVAERTAGFEGVALWLPPGRELGLGSMLRSGVSSLRWMLRPPFPNVRRMTSVLGRFDRRHKQLMPEPHWYLLALGVDPDHQGEGHGRALVQSGIEKADRDNRPIYLETETDLTVGFYQKLGFEVIDEMTMPEIDVAFSMLVRRPVASRA